jgi:hypothetical protein
MDRERLSIAPFAIGLILLGVYSSEIFQALLNFIGS